MTAAILQNVVADTCSRVINHHPWLNYPKLLLSTDLMKLPDRCLDCIEFVTCQKREEVHIDQMRTCP